MARREPDAHNHVRRTHPPSFQRLGENIILSPICAHVMGSRTFVLSPEREIMVRMEKTHGRKAYLSVDGNSVFDLDNGDFLRVQRSNHYALMVDMGLKSFYEIAFEKLK